MTVSRISPQQMRTVRLAAHHDGISDSFTRSGVDKSADMTRSPGPLGAPILDGWR